MSRCIGLKANKKPCTKRVISPNKYCHLHKNQEIIILNDNQKEKIITNRDPESTDDNICSICLCEVENKHDCNLTCGHKHHIKCIRQLHEPICPVCRHPLEGNKNYHIDKIQQRQEKDKIEIEAKANRDAIRQLQTEDVEDREQDFIDRAIQESLNFFKMDEGIICIDFSYIENRELERAIEESLILQEIEDYNIISEIIQQTGYLASMEI
jgi:hypothetical protein